MKLNFTREHSSEKTIVVLGTFDGVHRGHQQLLKQAIQLSKEYNFPSLAFTFDQPPEQFFTGKTQLLTDFKTKEHLLYEYGIDQVVWTNFNHDFAIISAVDFVSELLVSKLKAAVVVCGYDYRFGHRAEGDTKLLEQLGTKCGFEVVVIPPYDYENKPISSTRIRQALAAGEMDQVAKLLGRYHKYQGKVLDGKKLGRQLGYPTANIDLDRKFVLPKSGAYFTWVHLADGSNYPAMTSVSLNYTIEAHLIGFNGDLYGENIEISFLAKMRDWLEFVNNDQLKAQLDQDYAQALECLTGYRLQGQEIVLE